MDEILILGAGRVGSAIARSLAANKRFGVTVVDTQSSLLLPLQAAADLRTVQGNAADPQTLLQAGVKDATTVVAVTAIDEVNLAACRICSMQSETISTIARIRSPYYNEDMVRQGFHIQNSFCPEELIAGNIKNAIVHPGCLSLYHFANGKLALAGIRVSPKTDVAGKTISELRDQIKTVDFRIVSLYRDGEYLTPDAETRLFVGDDTYLVVATEDLDAFTRELAGPQQKNKRVFIAGGGGVGMRVAAALEKNCDVKILEINRDRCRQITQQLKNTLVLKGSASDENILYEEGISETDIFCALTNDDEENILASILAKRKGAQKTAVLINRDSYVDILERQFDIILSPSRITTSSLLSKIRSGNFNTVYALLHGSAEAVEFTVHGDAATSKIAEREIGQIEWPNKGEGICPGAILRGDEFFIAHDNVLVQAEDRMICFVTNQTASENIEKFIRVNLNYIGGNGALPAP